MSNDAAARARALAEAASASAAATTASAASTQVRALATMAILAGVDGDDDDVRTAEAVAETYGEAGALRSRFARLEQEVALFKRLLNPPADRRDDVAKALEGRVR